ncbi:hypothetical protein ASPSYDRAFT_39800 [Aspergillus sydowii CBS 593.65]|uniref:Uncharacterized protein n=1 Tax=Aspergillus sydowii CBS 593.65 TaxID=1036612 RepID=A0A1L9U031_9EURO|nr:uncharacterized protein ASPSYDRAFT_39800 [Aspergillus sydowii CBS 593.65]OJJ65015.1 hypothetical protein ASPSYDRAFT_39800 [Aspergillus sydowii CBS 593.65]
MPRSPKGEQEVAFPKYVFFFLFPFSWVPPIINPKLKQDIGRQRTCHRRTAGLSAACFAFVRYACANLLHLLAIYCDIGHTFLEEIEGLARRSQKKSRIMSKNNCITHNQMEPLLPNYTAKAYFS